MFFESTFVPSPPLSDTQADNLSADEEDHSQIDIDHHSDKPVDHVIFVIHGIGQQTEQYGQFYEHIEELQETTRQVLQYKIPSHDVRIELIPIEWHRHIHEQVDPIMNKITLKSIPTIRLIENEYLADVLYYFSKDRGQKIIDNVTHLFNTSYQHFIEKHPNFNGKVIILGYSLGGIITWDILSHQRDNLTEQEQDMYNKLDVKFSKLNFKPDYFFGLGSPLGAVLTFRGQNPTLYHPEHDIQFENIFHPFDPLGYRFEPLLNDYFTDKPAVLIDRSIPIGPSFSFPSFPISASLFSFFSWKQEDKVAGALYEATSDAAKNQEEQSRDVQEQIPSTNGFISSLLQYFSKGTKKEGAKPEEKCWEELDTREQLLALREDLDRTLTSADELLLVQNNGSSIPRPMIQPRSKTYSPPYTDDQKPESTETKRMQLRKTMTDQHSPSNCHHLVEVLGIDGLPRLERTKSYVDHVHEEEDKDEEKEGHTDEQTIDKESTASTKGGGDDIWSDLNAELHKPGPAITEPGESKEDVAQDSTVPNANAKDKDKVTDVEEEEQNEKSKLPGGRRIDYVLQPESMMAMLANEYLIGLRAHFSYWTNKDFIWHMLRRIENLNDKTPSVSASSSTPSNTSNPSKE